MLFPNDLSANKFVAILVFGCHWKRRRRRDFWTNFVSGSVPVVFVSLFPPDIVQRLSTTRRLSSSSSCLLWSPVLIIPRLRATHRLSSSSSSKVGARLLYRRQWPRCCWLSTGRWNGTSKKEKSARDDALTDATVKTPRAGALSMLLLFVRALHRTKRERNAAVRSPKTRVTVAFKLSSC